MAQTHRSILDRELSKFVESPSRPGESAVDVVASIKEAKVIIDQAGSITYIGSANPGSLESDAVWLIQKISKTGSITKVEFAGGSESYSNIWNNRASLTYS